MVDSYNTDKMTEVQLRDQLGWADGDVVHIQQILLATAMTLCDRVGQLKAEIAKLTVNAGRR